MVGVWLHDRMNMIRHHAPRVQPIAFSVKMTKRVRDKFGDPGLREPARAVTSIEVAFDSLAEEFTEARFNVGRQVPARFGNQRGSFAAIARDDGGGQRVGEAENRVIKSPR